jgi:hypothetical protein
MRRTASVLGSALVTLALAGSPAWAGTPEQSTTDSTGAAQVGPVDVDAPVRIASDGDNQGAAQGQGGSQSVGDSTGAAQVGPVGANAPVRVLSDGDNEAASQGGSTGEQSTTDSTGAAQVGPVDVDAPVRIASDGDNQGAAQGQGGSQSVGDSTGAAQVGPVGANAPVRVLSDGDNKAGGAGGDGGGGPPPGNAPDEGPAEGPTGPTEDGIDGVQSQEGDAAAGVLPVSVTTTSEGRAAAAAPSAGSQLPFTGFTVWLLLVIGASALGSGLCVQRLLGRQEVCIRSL